MCVSCHIILNYQHPIISLSAAQCETSARMVARFVIKARDKRRCIRYGIQHRSGNDAPLLSKKNSEKAPRKILLARTRRMPRTERNLISKDAKERIQFRALVSFGEALAAQREAEIFLSRRCIFRPCSSRAYFEFSFLLKDLGVRRKDQAGG